MTCDDPYDREEAHVDNHMTLATTPREVRVRAATYARGYSATDHLLRDSDFDAVLGRYYASRETAEEAVEDCSTAVAPVRIEYGEPTRDEIIATYERVVANPRYVVTDFPADVLRRRLVRRDGYAWLDIHTDEPMGGVRARVRS